VRPLTLPGKGGFLSVTARLALGAEIAPVALGALPPAGQA
jgi:hypothetical protein